MKRGVVVVGAGGMGREAAVWASTPGAVSDGAHVLGFIDDDGSTHGREVDGLPVLGGLEWVAARRDVDAIVAIGAAKTRANVARRLRQRHGTRLATVIHPSALVGPGSVIGEGSILAPNVVLTRDVKVGQCCIVNYGAALGHDDELGDYVFVGPGAHVAGNVTIGARSEVGIGSCIIQGVMIGADVTIGAGAAVVRDLPDAVTAVGVPARPRSLE